MNKDNRISSLPQVSKLNCFELNPFPAQFSGGESVDDDVLFLLANSGSYNEKITFKNLKTSILDSSVLLTGTQTINGEKTFTDTCTFLDEVYVQDYIKHFEDEETYILFENEAITLNANQKIEFNVSNDRAVIINEQGDVGINIEEQLGKLAVTGDAYIQDLYITNDQAEWRRFIERKEESVNFNTQLTAGEQEYSISFPKTFESVPSLSLSLQSSTGPILPFHISDVTEYNYKIKFGEILSNDSYTIHTIAKPVGITSHRQTKTVSFIQELTVGEKTFKIDFPEAFVEPPALSLTLEQEGVSIPYNIQSTTNEYFYINFGSDIISDTKLHIHATR